MNEIEIRKNVSKDSFVEEIAYHESAHFVLHVLWLSRDIFSRVPKEVLIDKKNISGEINFNEKLPKDKRNNHDFKESYKMYLLAGFCSYDAFVSKDGIIRVCNNKVSDVDENNLDLTCYSINSIFNNHDWFSRVRDFRDFEEFLLKTSFDKIINEAKLVISKTMDLLNNIAVRESIEYVKDKLLASTTPINGQELSDIISEVSSKLEKVDITKYIAIE